jgi:Fe-S-cluster containining protein
MTDAHPDLPVCAGCGICCHLAVELDPATDDIPEYLTIRRAEGHFMDQEGDGACVALDPVTKLCTIYEIRPAVCRIFTRGESLCRQVITKALARAKLPQP